MGDEVTHFILHTRFITSLEVVKETSSSARSLMSVNFVDYAHNIPTSKTYKLPPWLLDPNIEGQQYNDGNKLVLPA